MNASRSYFLALIRCTGAPSGSARPYIQRSSLHRVASSAASRSALDAEPHGQDGLDCLERRLAVERLLLLRQLRIWDEVRRLALRVGATLAKSPSYAQHIAL